MGGSAHTGSLLWPVMVRHRSQLLAFFSSMDSDSLFRASSYDDGAHWTQPRKLSVPSNSSPFAVLSLKSGRLVCGLVLNPTQPSLSLTTSAAWVAGCRSLDEAYMFK